MRKVKADSKDDASDVTPSSMSTPALGHKPLPSPLERRVTPYLRESSVDIM